MVDGIPVEAGGLILFPARLFLRKLDDEGSDYFAGPGNLQRCHNPKINFTKSTKSDDRS
jgi:hypothetical protein